MGPRGGELSCPGSPLRLTANARCSFRLRMSALPGSNRVDIHCVRLQCIFSVECMGWLCTRQYATRTDDRRDRGLSRIRPANLWTKVKLRAVDDSRHDGC